MNEWLKSGARIASLNDRLWAIVLKKPGSAAGRPVV